MNLRARIIRELRASRLPIGTGDLALLCAATIRYPTQRTFTELRRLEACGVVTRLPPVSRGRHGRPSVRWMLVTGGAGRNDLKELARAA
jgi:hypothetical protein